MKRNLCALALMSGLAACSSADNGDELASCIAPVQMDVGESVQYQLTLPTETLLVQLEKTSESGIALTRTLGPQVIEIDLRLDNSGTCPVYFSDNPLYEAEYYLMSGAIPFSTAVRGEMIAVNAEGTTGDSGVDSTAAALTMEQVNCTAAPPNATCEGNLTVESQSYKWVETKVLDGAKPAVGVNSLLITKDQATLLDIQVLEWNGL